MLLTAFNNEIPPDECSKWKGDGFKCVSNAECEDDHFDNSGGVPAIRLEYDEDDLDISEVNYAGLKWCR